MPPFDSPSPGSTQAPSISPLTVLLSLIGLAVFGMVFFLRPADNHAYARAVLLGNTMMHSQRLAKATPSALEGTAYGFRQLQESDQVLDAGLKILAQGGDYQGMAIQPPNAKAAAALKEVRKLWAPSHEAAKTILSLQEELTSMSKNLVKMREFTPMAQELGQNIAILYVRDGASTREISASSQLLMLNQRLAKHANEIMGHQSIDPETVFMLNKDAEFFHNIINGLLQGSEVLRLPASKNPETRDKLSELQAGFAEYHKLIGYTLQQLPKLIAAKQAEALIFADNEQLKESLQKLQHADRAE